MDETKPDPALIEALRCSLDARGKTERDPRVEPRPGDVLRDTINLVHDVLGILPDGRIQSRVVGTKGGHRAEELRCVTATEWAARMTGATIEKRGDQ